MVEKKTQDIGKSEQWDRDKGEMDDELLPNRGEPVPQEDLGGDEPDSAGKFGEMRPESARGLGSDRKRSRD